MIVSIWSRTYNGPIGSSCINDTWSEKKMEYTWWISFKRKLKQLIKDVLWIDVVPKRKWN